MDHVTLLRTPERDDSHERSTGLELLGGGFDSASLPQIMATISEFFQTAATEPFNFAVQSEPLTHVESLWNTPEHGARLVFLP